MCNKGSLFCNALFAHCGSNYKVQTSSQTVNISQCRENNEDVDQAGRISRTDLNIQFVHTSFR